MKKITFLLFALFCFAYTWQSNAQLAFDNTCTTSFDDISSTGVNLALTDDSEANITIPFAFTLDGVSSSNLRVGNNGGVLFNATTGDIIGGTVATAQGFYIMQTDIDSDYGGVFWETLGTAPNRRVVILWNDRPHYSNSPSGATFEIILYETTNEITFLYQDTDFGTGNSENDAAGSWIRVIGANGTYEYSTNTALGGVTCINWSVPDCDQVEVASTKTVNCGATEYSIEVDVTLVGDATEITDGTTTWPISGVGIVTVGPFAFNSSVNLAVIHSNLDCNLSLGDFNLTTCPPSNDDCENAIDLTVNADLDCGVVTNGTTLEATNSGIEPTFEVSGTPDNDVWYSFVASSANHRISLTNVVAVVGTATDMGMAVFDGTGNCSSLVLVGSSDPNLYDVIGLTVGTTYYVAVYGWSNTNTAQATFDICVGTLPPPPVNDECAGAIPITESTDLSCDNIISGTTVDAYASNEADCSTTNKDVWYVMTAAQTNTYKFTVTETQDYGSSSTYVSVFQGGCGALTQVGTACSSSNTNLDLVSGTTYYINVRSTSTTAGVDFDLCVAPYPPAPANDDCANAFAFNESPDSNCANGVLGTTVSATASSEPDNCSTTNKDVWYVMTASETNTYKFLVTEEQDYGTSSTYVSVFEGSCGALTQVGTACTSTNTNVDLVSGTTYYINVRSTSTSEGVDFYLCAFPLPPAPVNDDCAGALVLPESTQGTCDNAVSGTTFSATASSEADCSTTQWDVWYTFVPSTTNNYIFIVTETFDLSSASTYVSVFEGSCGALTQVGTGCSSSTANLPLTSGNTYYVNVRSTSTVNGVNFDLCVSLPALPPANNDCSAAVGLTPGATFDVNPIVGTTNGATGSGELPLPGCALYDPSDASSFGGDVWYSVTVPTDGNLTIQTNGNPTGASGDSGMAVYSGTCGALVLVECDDDDSPDGTFSQVVLEPEDGLAGQTVYVRVWEFGGDTRLNFQVSAYSATLSSSDLEDVSNFTYYPNPVKNTLNLRAQSNIQSVSIFNMLGQEVLRTTPNNVENDVDMSSLQTGAYFVKVTINDRTETVRVIKQ